MPSHSTRRALLRRRRRLALVVAAAALLGAGGSAPARAQDGEPTGTVGEVLFGIYELDARSSGVQARYELEGILPGGAPVLDLTLPETATRFGSGPIGYGLAGLAYPGPLLANLGVLAAQGGFGSEDSIPPWPIKAEAFYPTGPTEVDESQGPAIQRVASGDLGVLAHGAFPAIDAPPVLSVGTIEAASRSAIEGELAVSRSRVVLGDVKILGGLIGIDSLVTDLVAAHDGTTGSTSGGTIASGVTFLGLAARLTEEGLVLEQAAPVQGPAAPAGGALDPLLGPLQGAVAPVQQALTQVLGQAMPQVDEILAQAGITLSLVEPHDEQIETGAASRLSSGLALTFSYKGREQQALVDLVNSIPADLKPNLGPIPNPVTFLAENHITSLNLAPGSVSALATPPFPTFDVPLVDIPTDLTVDPGTTLGDPGFATTPAPRPAAPAAPGAGGTAPETDPISTLGGALPAVLVALVLMASPFFGLGSSRLADNVLAPAATACPNGLDQPPAPRRRP